MQHAAKAMYRSGSDHNLARPLNVKQRPVMSQNAMGMSAVKTWI